MDYLSLLTLQSRQADVSAVVLNSITNIDKAIPFLSKHAKINAFLDNDEAGKKALQKLQKLNLPVADISKRYAEFKDVNEYLYLKSKAKTAGKNRCEFLRELIFSGEIKQRFSAGQSDVFRKISGMANNLNQLAKLVHVQGV